MESLAARGSSFGAPTTSSGSSLPNWKSRRRALAGHLTPGRLEGFWRANSLMTRHQRDSAHETLALFARDGRRARGRNQGARTFNFRLRRPASTADTNQKAEQRAERLTRIHLAQSRAPAAKSNIKLTKFARLPNSSSRPNRTREMFL